MNDMEIVIKKVCVESWCSTYKIIVQDNIGRQITVGRIYKNDPSAFEKAEKYKDKVKKFFNVK